MGRPYLRVGHGGQGGGVGKFLRGEGGSTHPHASWSHPSGVEELVALRPEGGPRSYAVLLDRISRDWLPRERGGWTVDFGSGSVVVGEIDHVY